MRQMPQRCPHDLRQWSPRKLIQSAWGFLGRSTLCCIRRLCQFRPSWWSSRNHQGRLFSRWIRHSRNHPVILAGKPQVLGPFFRFFVCFILLFCLYFYALEMKSLPKKVCRIINCLLTKWRDPIFKAKINPILSIKFNQLISKYNQP